MYVFVYCYQKNQEIFILKVADLFKIVFSSDYFLTFNISVLVQQTNTTGH